MLWWEIIYIYTTKQIYTDKSFGNGSTFDEWKNEYLQTNRYLEYLPDTYSDERSGLNFVNTVYKSKDSIERVGAMIVRINVDMLVNDIFMDGFSANSSFYVLNNLKKPLISYNLNQSDIDSIPYVDVEGNGRLETAEKRIVVFNNLGKNHWVYAVGDSKSNIFKSVYLTRIYFGVIAMLYVLIGVLLVLFGLRKSGENIDGIVNQLGVKQGVEPLGVDDIKKRIVEIKKERVEYESRVKSYENDKLVKFISGEGSIEERNIPNGIELGENNIRVMIIRIVDGGIFDTDSNEDKNMPAYCLINILDEVLDNVCVHYIANQRNKFVLCLLNYSIDDEKLKITLNTEVCEKIQSVLLNEFCIDIEFGISRATQDIKDIAYLYSETLMIFDYSDIKTNNSIRYFESFELSNQNEMYYYPNGYEENIVTCIVTGNKKGVTGILDELLEKNLKSTNMDLNLKCFLFYNLLSAYKKATEKINYTNQKTNYFLDRINKASPVMFDECIEELCREIFKVCDFAENLKQNDVDKVAVDVERYISENFADVNLNLNTIADYFGISRQTLSKKFNVTYGKKIGDYILEIRVQESKRLMQKANINISDVAGLVGYSDSNSFIRAFKKHCGVTPGQYKKNLVEVDTD